jgi:hypothetical protein
LRRGTELASDCREIIWNRCFGSTSGTTTSTVRTGAGPGGARTDEQCLGDLAVAAPGRHQGEHLGLARGQAQLRGGGRRGGGRGVDGARSRRARRASALISVSRGGRPGGR